MGPTMRRRFAFAPAVALLAACQSGQAPAPAQRAAPPVAAVAAVADPTACWAQARVSVANGVEDRLFAVPCPDQLTPVLWASVQRALAARGLYTGPITGEPDAETGEALRRYQAPMGLDSPVLSLDAARHLGLVAWPRTGG